MNEIKVKYKRKCESCGFYFLIETGYSSNRIYCDGCRKYILKNKVNS